MDKRQRLPAVWVPIVRPSRLQSHSKQHFMIAMLHCLYSFFFIFFMLSSFPYRPSLLEYCTPTAQHAAATNGAIRLVQRDMDGSEGHLPGEMSGPNKTRSHVYIKHGAMEIISLGWNPREKTPRLLG